jgi:glycosyl transferase family 2
LVFPELVVDNFIGSASTPLIRRTSLTEVGGYDATLITRGGPGCEDYKLNLAIAERYAFAVVPAFLVGYRQTVPSMSQHALQMKRSYDMIMAEVRHRHPELPARIFRWSEGNFCVYLGAKCLMAGHPWRALMLLPRTLRGDWAFLFRPKVRRVLLRTLLRHPGESSFLNLPFESTITDRLAVGRREQRRQRLVGSLGGDHS